MNYELEKSDFHDMQEAERIASLNQHCEETENQFTYTKPLSEDDIKQLNIELNQALQRIEELSEERKELGKQIREQNLLIKGHNFKIINKGQKVTEMVWVVTNLDTGYLETINSEGLIVEKKKIKNGAQVNMFRKHEHDSRDAV